MATRTSITNDKSRNSLFFNFLTGGELFQNNHHTLSSRVNFGVKNGEGLDPSCPVIWTLDKLGIIKLRLTKVAALEMAHITD